MKHNTSRLLICEIPAFCLLVEQESMIEKKMKAVVSYHIEFTAATNSLYMLLQQL